MTYLEEVMTDMININKENVEINNMMMIQNQIIIIMEDITNLIHMLIKLHYKWNKIDKNVYNKSNIEECLKKMKEENNRLHIKLI